MTVYRELFAHYTDGTTKMVDRQEDTPEGRRVLDRFAMVMLANWWVESCYTITTTRHTGRKGTVR